MGVKDILNTGLNNIMGIGGLSSTINIISCTNDNTDYDDEVQQTQTGSSVVSGLVFPVKATQGSENALLMQQGRLLTEDKVLITGSVSVSGNVIIELKSGEYYTIIPDGIQSWEINGSTIYQKCFIRRNLGGSMF